MLASRHLIVPHRVLLVSICQGPALFALMGSHSVCIIVMCNITIDSTTMSYAPITVVLCTASFSTAIIGFVTVVSTSSIVLTAYIVLTCTLRRCSIFHLHLLNNFVYLLQLCVQLLLSVLHCVVHMIYMRLHDRCSLRLDLLLLQVFL